MIKNLALSAPERLQHVFEHIAQTSMADMPMANPAISVEALGFRSMSAAEHDSIDTVGAKLLPCEVGVLITPWCMNLILLPKNPMLSFPIGREYPIQLPSATYLFVGAFHQDLGFYASCSLYSPMFEFVSHSQALEVAQLISSMIWESDPPATTPAVDRELTSPTAVSRRNFMLGRRHHE